MTREKLLNLGMKIGFGLMKLPAAAVAGLWKTALKVVVVILTELMDTLGVMTDTLKSMVG